MWKQAERRACGWGSRTSERTGWNGKGFDEKEERGSARTAHSALRDSLHNYCTLSSPLSSPPLFILSNCGLVRRQLVVASGIGEEAVADFALQKLAQFRESQVAGGRALQREHLQRRVDLLQCHVTQIR